MMGSMRKLSTGPLRQRRITISVWLPALYTLGSWEAPGSLVALAAALVCVVRLWLTGVEVGDGGVTVVNFFRTTRFPPGAVTSAGFAPAPWHDRAVPLVLSGEGFSVRAGGVSAWTRAFRWPDQDFVSGRRNLRRVRAFFAGTGIEIDLRDPVVPTAGAA